MGYTHEGATQKINNLKNERGWSKAKASRFHDWLTENYPDEKDEMSYTRLREVADEFEADDKDKWDD